MLVAAVLCFASTAASQEGPESPRKDASVRSTVSINVIDLDASATSRDGTPVEDLRADEVALKLDGKPVPLDYFTRVDSGHLLGPARPGSGADASGLVARHFFLIVDEDHLLPQDYPRVHEAARALLSLLEPSDQFAAAVLQQRRLRSLVPFGSTTEAAGKALGRKEKESPSMGVLSTDSEGRVVNRFDLPFPSTQVPTMAAGVERNSFRLLERAIRAFGSYPGRKEMVVISRGLNLYEGTGYSLRGVLNELVSQANRSRVTVHTIGSAELEPKAGFS